MGQSNIMWIVGVICDNKREISHDTKGRKIAQFNYAALFLFDSIQNVSLLVVYRSSR